MSEFFRVPSNPELRGVGLTSLARLSHKAEDTGNDILLMPITAEVESRGATALEIFRAEYVRLHPVIAAERKAERMRR